MRCKKHGTDLSSIIGVCASCLRERLFKLILAQQQYTNTDTTPTLRRPVSPYTTGRKTTTSVNPPPTVHRPYNNNNNSNNNNNNKPRLNHSLSDKRFYNSPQIAINTGGCIGGGSSSSNRKKPTLIRFPTISNLFRSNSRSNGDADSNHRVSVSTSAGRSGGGGRPSSVTPSPGAGVLQKNKPFNVDEFSTIGSTTGVRKQRCLRDRGMSPARSSSDGDDDDDGGEFTQFSNGSSKYGSSESCKRTPMTTVRRGGGRRSVGELILCPLVGASPNRLLKMNGKLPVDGGFSGDVRVPVVPHLAYAKSFCANRSRKLADFGRSDPTR